ncbi:MAG: family 78 glycoside hydrolase catalytic domain, partial [Oscillospiraceae bacterium]|nr:family 78 glycoside hydrolase catalytic domain [Oscillospiraceae bacterium]
MVWKKLPYHHWHLDDLKEGEEIMSKKFVFKASLALLLVSAMLFQWVAPSLAVTGNGSSPPMIEEDTFIEKLHEMYDAPEQEYWPWVRWWLDEGHHTDATLNDEMEKIHEQGMNGAEILGMPNRINSNSGGNLGGAYDDQRPLYGWGSAEWINDTKLLIQKATELGMGMALTSGANWESANLPSTFVYDGEPFNPDNKAAMKQLSITSRDITAGQSYSGALTKPTRDGSNAADAPFDPEYVLQGVYAYSIDSTTALGATMPNPGTYDSGADVGRYLVRDLTPVNLIATGAVDTENLTMTYINNTDYPVQIVMIWLHGTCQTASPSVTVNWAVNYLDPYGIEALEEYWEEYVLTPDMQELITENGKVELYMDSLELSCFRRNEREIIWGLDVRRGFEEKYGYDPLPWIPFVRGNHRASNGRSHMDALNAADKAKVAKIRNDIYDYLTQMYAENTLRPLKEWLNSKDMTLRAEISYNQAFEISIPAEYVDGVETEALDFESHIDRYRVMSGGAHIFDKTFSVEMGALGNGTWKFTPDAHNQHIYAAFAAGVQKNVLHGYSSVYGSEKLLWPGNDGMYRNYPERFSERQPYAAHFKEWFTMISRYQKMLQQGTAKMDLAVLRTDYRPESWHGRTAELLMPPQPVNGTILRDSTLQQLGYTYDYFAPALLEKTDYVKFGDGLINPDTLGYQAAVLYQEQISLSSAEKLLAFAQGGLPVVFINGLTERVQDRTMLKHNQAASKSMFSDATDEEVQAVVAQIKALPTTRIVDAADDGIQNDAYLALRELGVYPRAAFREKNHQIVTAMRETDDEIYLFAYNHRNEQMDAYEVEITLDALGKPYRYNAYTGDAEPIPYTLKDGTTVFTLAVRPGDATMVVLDKTAAYDLHVVGTTADKAYVAGGRVKLFASESGEYTAALSDGTVVTETITAPADIPLSSWDLTVEKWTADPGGAVVQASETRAAGWASAILGPEASQLLFSDGRFGTAGISGTYTTTEYKWPTLKVRRDAGTLSAPLPSWRNIAALGPDREYISGIGTYTTTFELPDGWNSDHGAYLDIDSISGNTAGVFVNGRSVTVLNPRDCVVEITDFLVAGPNTVEIEVTSILQNAIRELYRSDGLYASANGETFNAFPGWSGTTTAKDFGMTGNVTLRTYAIATSQPVDGGVGARTSIVNLKTIALENPLGIDEKTPDFSWAMSSEETGQAQTSYRLQVSRDDTFTDLVWDTGRVPSNASVGIVYAGDALTPETDYWWRVIVTDAFGRSVVSDTAFFSTGLMDPSPSAWGGAQFIGSDKQVLDAASSRFWRIRASFRMVSGDNVSFIFGADDFRLTDAWQNQFGSPGGENFIRLEITGIGTDNAALNLYRVGYHATDNIDGPNEQPLKTLATAAFRNLFGENRYGIDHTIDIACQDSNIQTLNIDGTNFITGWTVAAGRLAANNNANVSPYATFTNPAGPYSFTANNSAPTYPHLASVGFQVNHVGDEVKIINYRIVDNVKNNSVLSVSGFHSPRDFLNATTGATYDVFTGLPGANITADGQVMTVKAETPTETGPKYADPSFGSQAMVRTTFVTDTSRQITDAKMYITALGTYEMFINGRRMGEDYHNPGQSVYHKTLYYHTYDVTDMLTDGENALGATLSQDFWSGYLGPSEYRVFGDTEALMCKLVISYDEGQPQILVTDPSAWKVYGDGPVRIGSNFMGERYDASKEAAVEGWAETGYDDSLWTSPDVIPVSTRLPFEIVARRDQPVRLVETLTAQSVLKTHSPDNRTWTYDIGVNTVGVPSVTIPAGSLKEGDRVVFRYGEVIYPGNEDSPNTAHPDGYSYESLYGPEGIYRPDMAGRILTETYRSAMSADFYVASKEDETRDVVYTPQFTFHGYRYVQITIPGRTEPLPLDGVKALFLSSLDAPTGTYDASTADGITGDLLDKLFANTQRSLLSNYFSVPTDCPQRNERMGWTGDVEVFARTAAYHGDIQAFMHNWMKALRDEQGAGNATSPPGNILSYAPRPQYAHQDAFSTPGIFWAAAICMVPWQLYSQYGDESIIRENMNAMRLWLDAHAYEAYTIPGYPGLTTQNGGNGDHVNLDGRTPTPLVNLACLIYMMELTAKMADVVGETEYAQDLRLRHSQAVDSWNRAYVNPDTGMTRNATLNHTTGVTPGAVVDSQSSYAVPLNFNVISDTMTIQNGSNAGKTYREFAIERLAELVADPTRSGNGAGPSRGSGSTSSGKPYTLTTGFAGTPSLLPALSKGGKTEDAYRMIEQTEYASWLYPVTLGATSQWELWDAYERAFRMGGDSNMNSQNHFAPGAVVEWMYEYQLGITSGGNAGYRNFILQPVVGGDYTALKGSYTSNYGTICSAWTADGAGRMTSYSCLVPANTSATLYLPVSASAAVDLTDVPGLTYLGQETHNGVDSAKFTLVAGHYALDFADGALTPREPAAEVRVDKANKTITVTGTGFRPGLAVPLLAGYNAAPTAETNDYDGAPV